jgi:hypothetical protein
MRTGAAVCINPLHYIADETRLVSLLRGGLEPILGHPRLASRLSDINAALSSLSFKPLVDYLRDQSQLPVLSQISFFS